MKTNGFRALCIMSSICLVCFAQGQVKDDFSDGNFTDNPAWKGDTAQFEINSASQLHLQSAGSDTSVLATRSARVRNTEWSFWMKLSFNSSTNNNARIYLAADTADLLCTLNGYFIQAGGGDDSIYIMKQTGATSEKIFRFRSYKTGNSTNVLRFKIICDESGQWESWIDTTGGNNYFLDGKFSDETILSSRWFGLVCRYTSSNATKFYFDDFYSGPIVHDTLPPAVGSWEALTERTVRINFSEAVQTQCAELSSNYMLTSNGSRPDSARQDKFQSETVSLFFHENMKVGQIDSLRIQNILDLSENRMPDMMIPVFYYKPRAYDILIHEILADP
jgi:hypothetical protein